MYKEQKIALSDALLKLILREATKEKPTAAEITALAAIVDAFAKL